MKRYLASRKVNTVGLKTAAAGTERRCMTCQQNAQAWPWTVAAAIMLTRTGSMWQIQFDTSLPLQSTVSPQQGAEVPDRLLCCCLGYRWSSATALSTPSPAGCTVLSTNYTRPSGVLCRWTNRLEFASRWAQRWDWEHFPAVTENTAFQTIFVCSAHYRRQCAI